jgi:F0F1-type ATP synthase assembly protein I
MELRHTGGEMARAGHVSVLIGAVRLVLGCLLWLVCGVTYVSIAARMVMGPILTLTNLASTTAAQAPEPYWSFVGAQSALVVAGIACGVGLGWLTGIGALWLRLDWPHWAVPSLLVCGVFVGVFILVGGWSTTGGVLMLVYVGPILVGQFAGVRIFRSRRALEDAPKPSIQQAHRAERQKVD